MDGKINIKQVLKVKRNCLEEMLSRLSREQHFVWVKLPSYDGDFTPVNTGGNIRLVGRNKAHPDMYQLAGKSRHEQGISTRTACSANLIHRTLEGRAISG